MSRLPYYQEGLMQCCIDSIKRHQGSEEIGTEIGCLYHKEPNVPVAEVILDIDDTKAWRWVGARDAATEAGR